MPVARLSRFLLVISMFVILSPWEASSQFLPKLGARSVGMGGSFTALADDATSVGWNPACLTQVAPFSFAASGGIDVDDRGDFIDGVEELVNLDFTDSSIFEIISDVNRAIEILVGMERDSAGATGTRHLGIFSTNGNYGFSVFETVHATIAPLVDRVHVQPNLDPETSLLYNETSVRVEGLQIKEYTLSLAQAGDQQNTISAGLNLKYLSGSTYFSETLIRDLLDFSARDVIKKALKENRFDDSKFSWDVGFLIKPTKEIRVGLAARYLNGPEFEMSDGSTYKLKRRLRAGFAVLPAPDLSMAFDIDLTKSASGIPDVEQRQIAAGVEKYLFERQFALRGGANFYTGEGDNSATLFGGIGFGSQKAFVDVGLGVSPSKSDLSVAFQLTISR